ncbi:MAG: ribonuclease III [Bacteriovoracaceae bacterium]
MKNDLLSDYFLNEYIPMLPSYSKEDLQKEFIQKARELNLAHADEDVLFRAFTHKSFAHEAKGELPDNERLEFLGDSVLQLVVSEELLKLHPNTKEGKLSKLRSSIVNERSLSQLARNMKLNKLILLGKGELREKGYDKDSLLANCFEAYLGAVYLSAGLEMTRAKILEIFENFAKDNENLFLLEAIEEFDAKSRLQEKLMKERRELPKYVAKELGENNEKRFHISLLVKGEKLGELVHKSKKKGMQELAKKVLEDFNKNTNN